MNINGIVGAVLIGVLSLIVAPLAYAFGVGEKAPSLEAKNLDGKSFSLAAESGNVVIVNFWASWCEPCREEMPALETYYKQHKDEGLRVLAISMDDPADDDKVLRIMRAYSYPAAFQRNADYRGFGRIWRMPMTFVIDRKGVLRKDGGVGAPKIDLELLEKVATPLLSSGGN